MRIAEKRKYVIKLNKAFSGKNDLKINYELSTPSLLSLTDKNNDQAPANADPTRDHVTPSCWMAYYTTGNLCDIRPEGHHHFDANVGHYFKRDVCLE